MKLKKNYSFFIAILLISFSFFKAQTASDFFISDAKNEREVLVNCNYPLVNGNCVALTANYPSFKQTDNYAVSSINYTPYAVVNKTVITGNLDDSFSEIIDLPFKFCFYGQVYKQLVIGSNGMISFDTFQANQANPANFSEALPNQNLPKEAIFGVFHDMFFSESNGSEINYAVIGTAPYRKFVVNFRNGRISGCDSEASSSQIVLSEGSNNIEIFVVNKPLACDLASVKNAVIGINDATGDLGLAAPGRNTGNWSAQNEAWVFTPNADSLTPKIKWYDSNNNIIGTNKDLKVCPTKNETYRVEIIYTNCNNEEIIYSDTINVNFAADYPLVKDYSKIFCNNTELVKLKDYKSSIVTGNPSLFNFEFIDAATGLAVDENTPFSISANRNFKVTVSNKNDANCKKVANLSFLSQNIYNDKPVICDFANDGIENNFLLSNLNSQLVGTDYQGTVSYFTSFNDANNDHNAITNYNLNNGTQFYIRLVQGGCVNVLGPIEVRFNSSPVVNNASLNVTICDNNDDGVENFNWAENLKNKLTTESGMSIRVFNTYDEAFTALPNQLGLTQIREGNYKVYARVQSTSGCFSIAEVNMNVTFNSIEAINVDKYICFDGNEDKTIDLSNYKNEMLRNPSGEEHVDFFGSLRNAQNNSNKIDPIQTITNNGDYISKSFYARFSNGDCYTIKRIRIVLVKLTVNKDKFKVCDIKNDGLERITLSKYTREINNQSGTRVAFYLSEPEARDGSTTGLRFLDLRSSSTELFARISLPDCFLVVRITFNLVRTPNIVTEIVREFPIYCDNLADGKENIDLTKLEPLINTNIELVEFSYFKSYNAQNGTFADPYSEPSNTEVQDGDILYVKVKFIDSDCFSVAKVTVKLPVINDVINLKEKAVLKICNEDFSVSETFNLEEAVSQLFYQQNNNVLLENLQITYYVNENSAKQGTSAGKISAPSSYVSTAANTYVYARFQSQYGCYSIAPINLLFVLPAKAINSEITICDNNLDGAYDVNLLAYKDSMVQNPSEENIFKFYKVLPGNNSPGEEITNPGHFILDANTSKIWVYVENLPNCGSYAEINFKKGEVLTLDKKQFKIDNICDINNDKKEIIDLTGFERNFSSPFTYEYYGNQSDLWLGQNKIQNPASYAYDGNSGDPTIYVKVSQEGFCPDFYTINVVLKTTPMIEIPDYYYCKNDEIGLEIRPNFNGLNVEKYHWEFPGGTIKDGVDYLTNIKTLGTYTLTLTNSLGCTYTTTFKVLNEETPRIVSLTGKNDYYTIKAEGIPGKKIVYSKDLETWHDSNVFYNLEAGDYTFYVKYADSDCYGDSIKGKIFNLKNAFSPNGDGINDYWELTGLDVFSNNSTLQIFDRYGNMVYKEVSNTEFRWDGKSNSRVLNSDTYWFVITAGDERIYKGWIYLKNKK
ncbi:T9SS type B sorting domain-containing protein [Cloacibacterium caeni]|uniref:T9SS type B sorting domain-containing protein n=1 Tax=Cloacibacterium caeni TaxID=2004710 RepID=UPI001BCBB291|nr:T9SS type B sorting domain-containing protein [Cloacibacterium caeni]